MRNLKFLVVLFCIACGLSAQTKRFVYKYEFVPDINRDSVSVEYMFLDVGSKQSQFYSYENYRNDSTAVAFAEKGQSYMPPNREFINFRIIKDLGKSDTKMITNVRGKVYEVLQQPAMDWKITNKHSTGLGYSVISAETDFGGRHWTAWFAPDIPLQDGPYKFAGLPGLILKLEDDTKSHRFTAEQIQLLDHEFEYPLSYISTPTATLNDTQYRKLFSAYRKDPVSHLIGRFPDQTSSSGEFRTGAEVFREVEKAVTERLKRDNNIIEIDMLK